ncbi:MAG TPA: TIGR00725 family protein [Acidimicrobiales bacterium]
MRRVVAVIGGTEIEAEVDAAAERVGALLAKEDAIVVTGGRGGVAEAASRGASLNGGTTVGILPGRERSEANPWVEIAIPTGMGETRNALVVMDADAVIAFPGAYGTLIELGFALHNGLRVVIVGDWPLAVGATVQHATSPEEAVEFALASTSTR